jgi:antitoxin MazE
MKASIKKWGNSAAVRIPSAIVDASRVRIDEKVDIREEGGKIVIEPVRRKRYRLDGLLKKITDANVHEPVGFGAPEGNEVW